MDYKELLPYLQDAEVQTRINTSQMIANRAAFDPDMEPYLDAICVALNDENEHIRFNLLYALVVAVERDCNIQKAQEALIQALNDPIVKNQKEALWALNCWALLGNDIEKASLAIQKRIDDKTSTGNEAIGLAAHLLYSNKHSEALDFLKAPFPNARFGLAYAASIYTLHTEDKTILLEVLRNIKIGMSDRDLITGIAGALSWAKNILKLKTDLVHEAIQQVTKEAQDKKEVMQEAALGGIYMQLR